MIDEGYIKFDCTWIRSAPIAAAGLHEIRGWRRRLYGLGLIGAYPDGTGFGNISIRERGDRFIITGTQTGGIPELGAEGFTTVTAVNLEENSLVCEGPVRASSESLTHAAVYRSQGIGGVVHVHHPGAWRALRGVLPTTGEDVPYGTPAMAREIDRLLREGELLGRRIAVMAGHQDGIISLGSDLEEAGSVLLEALAPYLYL
jgi:hypothetical protein